MALLVMVVLLAACWWLSRPKMRVVASPSAVAGSVRGLTRVVCWGWMVLSNTLLAAWLTMAHQPLIDRVAGTVLFAALLDGPAVLVLRRLPVPLRVVAGDRPPGPSRTQPSDRTGWSARPDQSEGRSTARDLLAWAARPSQRRR